MSVVKFFEGLYTTLIFDIHPWLKDKVLIQTSIPTLVIIFLYFLFVLKIGPAYMKNRPPYKLKYIIVVYNIIQILGNFYIFARSSAHFTKVNWLCQPVLLDDSPESILLVSGHYYYFLLKILDLADTVFFVLRKKWNQVSFLHLYHHTAMVYFGWCSLKYGPGGQGFIVGFFNLQIHVIMYLYYLLTIMKVNVDKWKKYVTILQIIQHFCVFILITFTVLNESCAYPRLFTYTMWLNAMLFIYLFSKFYVHTYVYPKKVKAKQS